MDILINYKNSGKWMVFPNSYQQLLEMWNIVKTETSNGNLGFYAEVNYDKDYNLQNNSYGIINIYIDNYQNKDKIIKLGERIRDLLNYKNTMYYKPTTYTLEGKYGKGSWIYKIDYNMFEKYIFSSTVS